MYIIKGTFIKEKTVKTQTTSFNTQSLFGGFVLHLVRQGSVHRDITKHNL